MVFGSILGAVGSAATSFGLGKLFGGDDDDNNKVTNRTRSRAIVSPSLLERPYGTGNPLPPGFEVGGFGGFDFTEPTEISYDDFFSTPSGFSAGGLDVEFDNGKIVGRRDQSIFNDLRAETDRATSALRGLEARTALREASNAAVAELENQKAAALSDARESFGRNRLSGSSFATRELGSLAAQYDQDIAKLRADTILEEIALEADLIIETNRIETNRINTELEVALADAALVADLTSVINQIIAENERAQLENIGINTQVTSANERALLEAELRSRNAELDAATQGTTSLRNALIGQGTTELGLGRLAADESLAAGEAFDARFGPISDAIGAEFSKLDVFSAPSVFSGIGGNTAASDAAAYIT